ncbi:MAG: glycosyltransferase [Candidatus Aenigmatarchaeota archaeon]
MKITFLYPNSIRSPHFVHLTWAKYLNARIIRTPMGFGFFDINKIPNSDVLLLESLYCLPFAKIYKDKRNKECKIISIIADTSFWKDKLSIFRDIYYKLYLGCVDGFIAVSERIKQDIQNYINRPVVVVRPFLVNKFVCKKNKFNKKILFIGNEAKEKGYLKLIEATRHLPGFELFLVGNCCKKIRTRKPNIHVEGRVSNLKRYFDICTYYVHPADFDPCPVSVWEAMYSGLISIISKGVGQSEILIKECKELMLKDNKPITIAKKLVEIDNLSDYDKIDLSNKCKKIAKNFTKEKSVKEFKKSFFELLANIEK